MDRSNRSSIKDSSYTSVNVKTTFLFMRVLLIYITNKEGSIVYVILRYKTIGFQNKVFCRYIDLRIPLKKSSCSLACNDSQFNDINAVQAGPILSLLFFLILKYVTSRVKHRIGRSTLTQKYL